MNEQKPAGPWDVQSSADSILHIEVSLYLTGGENSEGALDPVDMDEKWTYDIMPTHGGYYMVSVDNVQTRAVELVDARKVISDDLNERHIATAVDDTDVIHGAPFNQTDVHWFISDEIISLEAYGDPSWHDYPEEPDIPGAPEVGTLR